MRKLLIVLFVIGLLTGASWLCHSNGNQDATAVKLNRFKDENGKPILQQCFYKNDKLVKRWSYNGDDIVPSGSHGLPTNLFKMEEWAINGNKVFETEVANKTFSGHRTDWWSNGKLKFKGTSLNGLFDGETIWFNNLEEEVARCIWKDGKQWEGTWLNISPRTGGYEQSTFKDGEQVKSIEGQDDRLKDFTFTDSTSSSK